MARYAVKVKKEKYGKSAINRIKVIGRIDFKSKSQKLSLNKRECPNRIVNGDYTPEEMQNAINEVTKETYDLAKSIQKNEGEEIQKTLNRKARKGFMDSESRFV